MLTLPQIVDPTLMALLRYFTHPIKDEAPVPVRDPGLPFGIAFPDHHLLVLAARAPMMLDSDTISNIASRRNADVLFVRLREDGVVTVDLALRHLGGVEILWAMRPARFEELLYLTGASRPLWASLTENGPCLTARHPLRTIVHDDAARAAASADIAAAIASAEGR